MENKRTLKEKLLEKFKEHCYPVTQKNNSIEEGMTLTGITQVINEVFSNIESLLQEERPIYDSKLQKWFSKHPNDQTTVLKCEKCGLYFKETLGHNCEEVMNEKEIIENFIDWFLKQKACGIDADKGYLLVGKNGKYKDALKVYIKEIEEE